MYMAHRVFDWSDQEAFACISNDYNPIHMDPVAARRTQPGAPIVHGIHSLIWILDCFSQSDLRTSGIKNLKVKFLRPIYVGEKITAEISQSTPMAYRMLITTGSEELVTATIGMEDIRSAATSIKAPLTSAITSPPASPNDPSLQEMEGMSGCLSFGPSISRLSTLYPTAVGVFGLPRIAALACSSCLVGMVVPGLHSLFSSLEVSFSADVVVPPEAIQFSVTSIVKRVRSVRINIRTQFLHGIVETVSRPPPAKQPSIGIVKSHVSREEFRDTVALIVGGSRGLGEITGKLIAAGGGTVVITYSTGKADADRVASEMAQSGLKCKVVCYDVNRSALEQLEALGEIPTQVYYFPTPSIFRRKTGIFDYQRFDEFNLFYVSAFFELVQACIRLRPAGIKFFYPSSTSVDVRPATMTEYTMSKAAAEVLCDDISRFVPGVQILSRRLPRLPTDQTSSTVQIETADPIEVLLNVVRDMHLLGQEHN